MRLGNNPSNEFLQILDAKNKEIQQRYLQKITNLTKTIDVKVMLGDSAITDQKTFNPLLVSEFFQNIAKHLSDWSTQDVSISNNEDIRRIFLKFERMIGSYLITGHLSIQFHVLLYYKPDHRVIECQKELMNLTNLTENKEQQMSDVGDQFILQKLKEMGYRDFDHQTLFEIFYANDKLREKLYAEIESTDKELGSILEKKSLLFDELDSLLFEVYHLSPVLIDDTRLVTGEEGCLCTLDIELVKNKSKQGQFDSRKMSSSTKNDIINSLDEILTILK